MPYSARRPETSATGTRMRTPTGATALRAVSRGFVERGIRPFLYGSEPIPCGGDRLMGMGLDIFLLQLASFVIHLVTRYVHFSSHDISVLILIQTLSIECEWRARAPSRSGNHHSVH